MTLLIHTIFSHPVTLVTTCVTPCQKNERCVNNFGTYKCMCRRGYVKQGFSCVKGRDQYWVAKRQISPTQRDASISIRLGNCQCHILSFNSSTSSPCNSSDDLFHTVSEEREMCKLLWYLQVRLQERSRQKGHRLCQR